MDYVDVLPKDLFAVGGNRLCFVHPDGDGLCVKVNRSDRSPAAKRQMTRGLKKFRPLRCFDDNEEEFAVMTNLKVSHPELLGQLIPESFGWVMTPYGKGFVSKLFRNDDGSISKTLEAEIFENGYDSFLEQLVSKFCRQWVRGSIPTRDLLLHNLVVVRSGEDSRIVVIDGLGASEILPLGSLFPILQLRKVKRKLGKLQERIREFSELVRQDKVGEWAIGRTSGVSAKMREMLLVSPSVEGEDS